ncbi:MAG: 30S ribosomal protein S7 [Chloroflexi bacterium]|nr:30S ribosomal protein S7 [Chloroflexota bacterium]|tara:strand:+ start:13976 stop:14446 length:471 start_codon:yes stop_codon:yes gene_type:complete
MSRRRRAEKRIVAPDPKFNSTDLVRFTNKLMEGGNKSVVQKIVYQVLEDLEQKTNKPGKEVFDQAIKNAMPTVEVKARRVGGATYQVPVEVKPARRLSLAIRWLVDAARSRSGMPLSRKLFQELLDASNGEGIAVKKKEDTHRMAEANRAFAHYRW